MQMIKISPLSIQIFLMVTRKSTHITAYTMVSYLEEPNFALRTRYSRITFRRLLWSLGTWQGNCSCGRSILIIDRAWKLMLSVFLKGSALVIWPKGTKRIQGYISRYRYFMQHGKILAWILYQVCQIQPEKLIQSSLWLIISPKWHILFHVPI